MALPSRQVASSRWHHRGGPGCPHPPRRLPTTCEWHGLTRHQSPVSSPPPPPPPVCAGADERRTREGVPPTQRATRWVTAPWRENSIASTPGPPVSDR